jgi:hypothetical protein
MSTKTLFALSTSALLMAIAMPSAALAQFPPPPGPPPALAGPPPGLGAGGPPPGLGAGGPRFGGPPAEPVAGFPGHGPAGAAPRDLANGPPRLGGAEGPHGLDRAGRPDIRGVEGRAAAYSANGYTHNNYTDYGHGYRRGYRYGAYAAAAVAYGYGRSYASSADGCYYVTTYRRSRRVLVCPDN